MANNRSRGLDVAVATPEIGGVTLRRHILDREAAGLAKIAQRLGNRLRNWVRQMPETVPAWRDTGEVDADGQPILEPIRGPDGVQLAEPYLPPEDFRENFDQYTKAVLGLLKEQRERAKLKPGHGAPAVDDATFEKNLGELVRQTIVTMPKRDLDDLLRMRAIDVSAGDAQVKQAHELRPVEQAEPAQVPTSTPPESSAGGGALDLLAELERKP